MKDFVLYHANCSDGSGAAMAAWLKLGDKATYLPVQYNKPMPEIEDGSNVYIVDFSYPRQDLIELHGRSASVVVLDHHETAMNNLEGLTFATFNMEKSGARLAWEYFHPDKDVPELITLIEDRDLWRFTYPNTRPVAAALSLESDFKRFADHLYDVSGIVPRGSFKLEFDQTKINDSVKKAVGAYWPGERAYKCALINTGDLVSDIGANFYQKYDVDFAVMYFFTKDGDVVFSFRSAGFKVLDIAESLGGGGHPRACSAIVKQTKAFELLTKLYSGTVSLDKWRKV